MIRVARGEEPAKLREKRYVYLARAKLAVSEGKAPICTEGYSDARDLLHDAQGAKCAYCEMQIGKGSLPVEHFRPKAKAIRHDGSADGGYWWLAWTWHNLLFSCATCNGSNHKGNHFGLEPGCQALSIDAQPPGSEVSSLLDPTREDPVDHIQFVHVHRHWRPLARGGSSRGRYTIKTLGLDRPPLLDFYTGHANYFVQPALDDLRAAIRSEDPPRITRTWGNILTRLFSKYIPYQALSYDVVRSRFSASALERWQLELPRPGRHDNPSMTCTEHEPPGMRKLSRALQLRVAALGHAPGQARLAVLEDVRAAQPNWSTDQLAALFEVSSQTIEADLAKLD